MRALPKGQVTIRILSRHTHCSAVSEYRLVTIARCKTDHQKSALWDIYAPNLCVCRRTTPHTTGGRLKPQNFLNRCRNEIGVLPQHGLLVGILDQQYHAACNRAGRGFITRNKNLLNHPQRLWFSQQATLINRIVSQIGDNVVLRRLAHTVQQRSKVVLELNNIFGILNLLFLIGEPAQSTR